MPLTFKKLAVRERANVNVPDVFQLTPGDWDDYSFKTTFSMTVFLRGQKLELGTVKIGYMGQPHGWTRDLIPESFTHLPDGWFSLGQDVEYYQNLREKLPEQVRIELLTSLRDVVHDESLHARAEAESVFKNSLMRGVSNSVIQGQFKRVLRGEVELSDFKFTFNQQADDRHAAVRLQFDVTAASHPPTNIHVLIGRNGVGKTTLLNNMVGALIAHSPPTTPPSAFATQTPLPFLLDKDYFSSVISVSFSAFDPFIPPTDRQDRTEGPAYYYVGMKTIRAGESLEPSPPKTHSALVDEFVESFGLCMSQPEKRARFFRAVSRLESDTNFKEMGWAKLAEIEDSIQASAEAASMARRMSSGHSIVLLTMTKLVEMVEEKSLVLLDEPESHLHPPLLSAFTRALSELLSNRNGVAIVATHSPVVLQEVPKSCVWKLTRSRLEARSDRPARETFGENVGVLTREVFGLEVSKSGFHEMLDVAVSAGGTLDSISATFGGQLGDEAQAILLSMLREKSQGALS
ncbi:AAA family ATPase [Paucibacter sp. R3-3]|uniref:AAA family ATPase n=1 Tax=Roseateles agri TaxID=3098619 RepID=A0ABU5DQW7_9BURK|nr:AAA family ATPase [Paucibacter sp. R3-3]MDY0748708.1 AAA family ATPase [Paucibacter sp. R3-3]